MPSPALRKYMAEFGVHMFSDGQFVLQDDDFDNPSVREWMRNEGGHIYAICRRPRIGLDAARAKFFRSGRMQGYFLVQHGRDWRDVPFDTMRFANEMAFNIDCPFPHHRFKLAHTNGHIFLEGKSSTLMTALVDDLKHAKDAEEIDLEILYIGQSYGTEGGRNAIDRLRQHSTLQEIYGEATRTSPDREIWIVVFGFQEPITQTSFDGRKSTRTQTSQEESDARLKAMLPKIAKGRPVSYRTIINFTEAAFIRYFRPHYNVMYKDRFPHELHKSYAECYETEINMIGIEILTEFVFSQLYSATVPRSWRHLQSYPLYSPEDRAAMMDLF
jgi:hypothetical protein